MPPWTPINARPALTWEIVVHIIDNLTERSISRWNQDTLNRVMRGAPDSEEVIPTHIGGSKAGSWERKEIASWWRRTMIEVINLHMERQGLPPFDPFDFSYLKEIDSPNGSGSQSENTDSPQ